MATDGLRGTFRVGRLSGQSAVALCAFLTLAKLGVGVNFKVPASSALASYLSPHTQLTPHTRTPNTAHAHMTHGRSTSPTRTT